MNLTQIEGDEPALLLVDCGEEENDIVLLNEGSITPQLKPETEKKAKSNLWYLDNGASNHMTGLRSKFYELDEGVTGHVRFGDGSVVHIKGKGSVAFECKNGEKQILREVYYIPSLCSNIISLGQLSEEGNRVVLNGEYLWVYDVKGRLLMKVQRSANRLYRVLLEDNTGLCLSTKVEEDSWLWHQRLGHVNFKAMSMMSKEEMAHGIPRLTHPRGICEGCLMSKQARKPFPHQTSFAAKRVLELIHGDICGPITPETCARNRYFLLLVDDFSRKMWVYMLKSKSEAFATFKKFRAVVENEREETVKVLRTDRGGEFCSNEFNNYCSENGITRHYTTPYTPQQNGVVERRNRTVVAMARSILTGTQLPLKLWGEAVRHSVYVLNRLPTKILRGRTPYEAWTGKKPNLSFLKVFGCLAFMKVPSVHTTKLDNRSKKVVYIGKEPGTKGYRLYDPSTGSLCVSRDVTFDETKGWTWVESDGETSTRQSTFCVEGILTNSRDEDVVAESEVGTPIQSHGASTDHWSCEDSGGSSGQSSVSHWSSEDSGGSSGQSSVSNSDSKPRKFRLISDVYEDAEKVELDDEELMLLNAEEPVCFKQAANERKWNEAMQTEINSIEKNQTWLLTELPAGHKPIGLKWVYKLKRDTNGEILKYKARLVAKGYVQKYGVDFEEVFAPVTRLETVRLLLALAAKNGWEVHHLDVKSAFLNGKIQEEVYVTQPQGFERKGEEHKVYKLLKAFVWTSSSTSSLVFTFK